MQVLLACDSPLLNELLALALREMPGVQVVEEGGEEVNVVIASAPAGSAAPELRQALSPRARLVVLDPAANVLRVWEHTRAPAEQEHLPGRLATLRQVLQRWECALTRGGEDECPEEA